MCTGCRPKAGPALTPNPGCIQQLAYISPMNRTDPARPQTNQSMPKVHRTHEGLVACSWTTPGWPAEVCCLSCLHPAVLESRLEPLHTPTHTFRPSGKPLSCMCTCAHRHVISCSFRTNEVSVPKAVPAITTSCCPQPRWLAGPWTPPNPPDSPMCPMQALDFYMIAAHLTPKDVLLWKRLAALSSELGFWRSAQALLVLLDLTRWM